MLISPLTLRPKVRHVDLIPDESLVKSLDRYGLAPYNHWRPFHTAENPTPESLAIWEAGIPCGDCKKTYLAIKAANPPRFADWFVCSWEIHNSVNAHLGRSLQSLDDARACWLAIAPCRQPRLVLTIAVGKSFTELLELTRPRMESYATRCNADFIALTNQQFDQWQREKFRTFELAKQYEQTLFLDADCIIRNTCPNLFELYRDSDVAMHDDLPYQVAPIDPGWIKPDHDHTMQSQHISPAWNGKLWNSGVVLSSKRAASIWKPPTHRLPDTVR